MKVRPLVAAMTLVLLSACGGSDSPGTESKTLTIKRDSYGVPRIYADTVRGVFHGYGYATAEDRLFHMEMARRSVLGTAAEVLGPTYAKLDASVRPLFNKASIDAQLAKLSQEDRDIFDGFADGYNERLKQVLANKAALLPKQFIDAGFEPSPWTGYDVAMIWVGTVGNRFSGGSSEIANLQLLNELKAAKGAVVGQQLFDQIRWLDDSGAITTVPRPGGQPQVQVVAARSAAASKKSKDQVLASAANTRGQAQRAQLVATSVDPETRSNGLLASWKGMAPPEDRPIASNIWIMGPSKTTDGSTILNNGPQFGWYNPSYVFGIGLHGGGFDATGHAPFSNPVMGFGTNGVISWGATAGPLDVNDMYQEKLNLADPQQYWFKGEYRTMDKRVETIKVKGEADQQVEVLSTVHGTVMSVDAAKGIAYSMRRSWTGYEVESLLGWIHLMRARNWDEFLTQAGRIAITINLYYADAKGNIGYASPGRIPIRPASQDVRLPALGDGTMEWEGIEPVEKMTKVYNPAQGYITNWNNQPAPGLLSDGGNYSFVDRVNEFNFRIEAKPKLTPAEVSELTRQTSLADTNARYFVPYILAATSALAPTDPLRRAAQLLADWNGLNTNPADGPNYIEPAATVLRAWLPIMYKKLLEDDLPPKVFAQFASGGYPSTPPAGSVRPGNGAKLLYNALLGSKAGVPQTIDFFNGADKNTMIREALTEAVNGLTTKFGPDMATWLTPVVKHRFLATNFMGYPQAGADENLELPTFMNRGTNNTQVSFSASGAADMCAVAPPGQSGFIAPDGTKSKHYADQMEMFKTWGCKPGWLKPQEVDAHLESTLQLKY